MWPTRTVECSSCTLTLAQVIRPLEQRVSQGFWGTGEHWQSIEGNKNPFLGSRGTKLHKLEDENNVSKFIKRRPNTEKVWEHGNIGQFWKGTREQGNKDPPGRPSEHDPLGLSQVPSCPQTPFGTLNFLFLVALAACGKFLFLEPQLLVNSWEAIYFKGGI